MVTAYERPAKIKKDASKSEICVFAFFIRNMSGNASCANNMSVSDCHGNHEKKHCIFHWFHRQPRWVRQKHVFDENFKKRGQVAKTCCRSNMALSRPFYRQNCLYLDRKDAARRGPRSFEPTFSLLSGPPGALDLRLCRKTARGREESIFFRGFYRVPGCGGEPERRGNRTFLLVLEPVTKHLYMNM